MSLDLPKLEITPYPWTISSALFSESLPPPPKSKINPYIFKRPESSNSASFGAVVLNPIEPMTTSEKIVQLNLGKHDFRKETGANHTFLKKKARKVTFQPANFTLFAERGGTSMLIDDRYPGQIVKAQIEKPTFHEAQLYDYLSFLDKENKFVAKFHDVVSYEPASYPAQAIYMEKLDSDLFKEITSKGKRLKLSDPRLKQLCELIRFYHASNLLYGDIKPNNFGLKKSAGSKDFDQIKGIDFDGSELLLPGETLIDLRTPFLYRAPEIILKLPYDKKIDVFSLGCLLYQLYVGEPLVSFPRLIPGVEGGFEDNLVHLHAFFERFGRYPDLPYVKSTFFSDYFDYDPFNKSWKLKKLSDEITINQGHFVDILKEKFVKDRVSETVGRDFIDLLTNMLEYDPKKRFNADQVVDHPFFRHTKQTPKPPMRKKRKMEG